MGTLIQSPSERLVTHNCGKLSYKVPERKRTVYLHVLDISPRIKMALKNHGSHWTHLFLQNDLSYDHKSMS